MTEPKKCDEAVQIIARVYPFHCGNIHDDCWKDDDGDCNCGCEACLLTIKEKTDEDNNQ